MLESVVVLAGDSDPEGSLSRYCKIVTEFRGVFLVWVNINLKMFVFGSGEVEVLEVL